ncbi:hypothetical protein WMY93_011716 [Mugilogobius chulae]|uniref:Uncharacterized protein n=1 Tax=Mugilogobius chulae TaxID=88201 RepID=A0AAW0P3M9_9GOBI
MAASSVMSEMEGLSLDLLCTSTPLEFEFSQPRRPRRTRNIFTVIRNKLHNFRHGKRRLMKDYVQVVEKNGELVSENQQLQRENAELKVTIVDYKRVTETQKDTLESKIYALTEVSKIQEKIFEATLLESGSEFKREKEKYEAEISQLKDDVADSQRLNSQLRIDLQETEDRCEQNLYEKNQLELKYKKNIQDLEEELRTQRGQYNMLLTTNALSQNENCKLREEIIETRERSFIEGQKHERIIED